MILLPVWWKQLDAQDFGYQSGGKKKQNQTQQTGTCSAIVPGGKEGVDGWDWAEGMSIKDGASILHHEREILPFCFWGNKTEQEGDSLLVSHHFSFQHTAAMGVYKL